MELPQYLNIDCFTVVLTIMTSELRKLLNIKGEEVRSIYDRRRKILKYIANHPGSTPYEIAKNVLGAGKDGVTWSSSVFRHMRRIERIGGVQFLLINRDEHGNYHVSLTEEGRILCENEGLLIPSDRTEAFIHTFNKQLDQPLTVKETVKLKALLSPKIIDSLSEIASGFKTLEFIPLPELSPLDGLWFYDAEKNEIKPDKIKSAVLLNIYRVHPQLQKFPKNIVRREAKEMMRKVDLDTLLVERLKAIPIARKYDIETDLDKLVDFIGKIATNDRGKIAAENRRKAYEIYGFRYGTEIQIAIAQRYQAP